MRISDWSSDVCSSDLMLAVVLFVQMLGAFLAGTFEFGLSHNYSMLRFAEFVAMALLQAVFAGLLTGELLDRFGRRPQPAAPVLPLAARLAEIRRLAPDRKRTRLNSSH